MSAPSAAMRGPAPIPSEGSWYPEALPAAGASALVVGGGGGGGLGRTHVVFLLL